MQATLEAWNVRAYGGPDVLSPVSRVLPEPGQGQVLIRIRASAVTRADGMMRAGQPKFARLFLGFRRPRAGLSGTCFSGDVVAVGQDVTRFKPGEPVFGEAGLQFGANASHICIDADGSLVAKPEALSYDEAAVMCDGAMTSWHFLTEVAPVQPGDNVLILGGAGSLGTAAIQIAKALGADVTATASARNAGLLESLGVDRFVDYTKDDPLQIGANYDIVFDTLGVSGFGAAKPALSKGGRYTCPVLSLRLLRDMIVSGFVGAKRASFAAAGMARPETHRAHLSSLLALIEQGRFRPVMDRTYPFTDLVEAHRYVAAGHKRGNVVIA